MFFEEKEVGPVFMGALHWTGETACRSSIRHPSLSLMRAWGGGGGIQGPELDTSAGLGDRVKKSNKGLTYI